MKTLHLTLKKKWFDLFLDGIKKEEYRQIKAYWIKRFCKEKLDNFMFCDLCEKECFNTTGESKPFDIVVFTNGYNPNSPQFTAELKGIKTGIGNKEWGAPEGEVFILSIGTILSTKNIKN